MTVLASAVAIGDTQLIIDAPFAAGQIPGWVKIDSEMLHAGGQHWRTGTTLTLSSPATATHSNGATVTYAGRPYDADFLSATAGGGGGGVTVDNQSDPPAEVTTIIAPYASVTGDEADLLTLPSGWEFDIGNSDFLHHAAAGILIGDLTENGPFTKIEATRITVSGSSVIVQDGTELTLIFSGDASDGFRVGTTGGALAFHVTRAGGVIMAGLPTADPVVAGQLWNDTGTLKVSAG